MSDSLLTAPAGEIDKAAAAAAQVPSAEAAAGAPAAPVGLGQRPPYVPEKFWDPRTGTVRVEQLARSYQELERRLHAMVMVPGAEASPEDRAAFDRARGVPERPDGYSIEMRHPLLGSDPQLNAVLHANGFTPQQAQLVYDLAAERVLPVIEELAAEYDADRQLVRLIDHYGGEERWQEISRQMLAWGKANLPEDVLRALATTFEGVLTLERMMKSGEPGLKGAPGAGQGIGVDEEQVKALMRDPRYWRDRDPALVRQVTQGFQQLYPG